MHYLDQGPHHPKAGETQVLKRTRFADGVEKRIEEERNVC